MSDTDSFIDEVTEEVRREKLFGYVKRYGWIAALLVVVLVGGAAWSEWRKAQAEAQAEALGDDILAALSIDDAAARGEAILEVQASDATARAALDMIAASELAQTDMQGEAIARLQALSENGDVPDVYRQIAGFKALLAQSDTLSAEERRTGFGNYDVPGNSLRLLAQEQLALISIEEGDTDAALTRLQSILADAETSADLQQRAMQVIVALGGEPDLSALIQAQN